MWKKNELDQHETNLKSDLRVVGDDVPHGFPNSVREGMHRGNGLFAGSFAVGHSNCKPLIEVEKIALAQWRTSVASIEHSTPASRYDDILLQPGPFLYTTEAHKRYAPNKKPHNDSRPHEPLNIKLIAVLTNVAPYSKRGPLGARVFRAGVVCQPLPKIHSVWMSSSKK